MKKVILTENQFYGIVKEELGISNKIYEESLIIYNLLEKDIRLRFKECRKEQNFSTLKGEITYNFLNHQIYISYEVFNYFTKEYYEYSNIKSSGWSYINSKHNNGFIEIIIPCISGSIIKEEVIDTIQHEVEHIYQQILMGKEFSNSDIYSLIMDNINSENKFVSDVANLVYGCVKSEQDGYINGLYAYLMSVPEYFSMETLKKTSCWKLYEIMIKIFNSLKDNPEFNNELKKYKTSKNKVIHAINSFIRKIGKVIIKIKQDKIKKQHWRT